MPRIFDRLGFALAGALGVALIVVLAGAVRAGPLNPDDAPNSTDSVRLPGTPISSVPFPIDTPGHYYLTRNLSINDATAITVNVSDVSIDLGGFTISGNDSNVAFRAGVGAGVGGLSRVVVRNGTIRDFNFGVFIGGADNRFDDLTLTSNVFGISLGTGNVLTDCIVTQNTVGVTFAGAYSEVRRCNINTNVQTGIAVGNGVTTGLIERTSLFANNQSNISGGAGILMEGSRLTIRDGEFANNAQGDIHLIGADNVIIDNAISCPTWITTPVPPFPPPPPVNNFAPVNAADPHTNRAHKATCP